MSDKVQNKEKAVIRMLKYILPHWYLIVVSAVAGVIKLTLLLLIFVYIPMTYLRDAGAQEVSNRVMHKMRCRL